MVTNLFGFGSDQTKIPLRGESMGHTITHTSLPETRAVDKRCIGQVKQDHLLDGEIESEWFGVGDGKLLRTQQSVSTSRSFSLHR